MSDRGVDVDQKRTSMLEVETDSVLSMKAMWQDGLRRYEAGDHSPPQAKGK